MKLFENLEKLDRVPAEARTAMTAQIARRGKQILTDVGAKVIGVVLNRATLRSHDYYYYQSYYGDKYYKGSENEVEAAS